TAVGVAGHPGPYVRGAGGTPAVALPRRARRIRLARRDRVPAPAERAAARVVGAHHATLEVGATVVADGGADDDEPVDDRRRRRQLIAAAGIGDVDPLGQIDLAGAPEFVARHSGRCIESHEARVDGAEEDATAARAVVASAGIEPRRHAT